MSDSARILFLDIETRPALGYFFKTWQPIIGMDQIVEPSRMIAWSAQWYGTKKTLFASEFHDGRDSMLEQLHDLVSEANVLATYNGGRFDIPWIRDQWILARKTPPPPPDLHIDLYQSAKKNMRLLSGKLDYLSLVLLNDRKVENPGFSMWRQCMEGDPKAWALMKKYSLKDTALMLPIYDILRPWIKNVPNPALYGGDAMSCPRCGSTEYQSRGFSRTQVGKYRRYQCSADSCGGWFRGKSLVESSEFRAL